MDFAGRFLRWKGLSQLPLARFTRQLVEYATSFLLTGASQARRLIDIHAAKHDTKGPKHTFKSNPSFAACS